MACFVVVVVNDVFLAQPVDWRRNIAVDFAAPELSKLHKVVSGAMVDSIGPVQRHAATIMASTRIR